MKISLDDKFIFSINDTQKKLLQESITDGTSLEADIQRRLHWIIFHKYQQCYKALKQEWDTKFIANGVTMVPTNPDEYVELVFKQPNFVPKNSKLS